MTKTQKENVMFGKKVKKRLVDKGMTSKELAEMLNVDPRYISMIICGRRSGIKYKKRIMEILDMTDAA